MVRTRFARLAGRMLLSVKMASGASAMSAGPCSSIPGDQFLQKQWQFITYWTRRWSAHHFGSRLAQASSSPQADPRCWPELQRFSNQMLRYQRKPEGLIHEIGLPAHRAMPDAYVTAHHLRDLLNAASPEQLLIWSNEPGLLPRVQAGPNRGKSWDRISDEALAEFLDDRDLDVRFSAETEVVRRTGAGPADAAIPTQATLL